MDERLVLCASEQMFRVPFLGGQVYSKLLPYGDTCHLHSELTLQSWPGVQTSRQRHAAQCPSLDIRSTSGPSSGVGVQGWSAGQAWHVSRIPPGFRVPGDVAVALGLREQMAQGVLAADKGAAE